MTLNPVAPRVIVQIMVNPRSEFFRGLAVGLGLSILIWIAFFALAS
jgi:hypothetical protein